LEIDQENERASKAMAAGRPAFSRFLLVIVGLVLLLLVVVLAGTAVGAVPVKVRSVVSMLFQRGSFGHRSWTAAEEVIVFQIRLPRLVASALVGGALSAAGVLFQGLFRNPLADPYVIGSQGGAALGASIAILLLPHFSILGFSATASLAFVGSVLTMAVVYWLARVGGRTPIVTLLLAGFALSTILSYSTTFFMYLNPRSELATRMLITWMHGAISISEWPQIAVISVLVAAGVILSLPLARALNALSLGEEYAEQLGVRVELARVGVIAVGSLLTAAAVSLGGLIGFVGLIVPHFCRLLQGPDHLRLLPTAALSGAIFLILADTLARTVIAPSELPVGILTAFIGGPAFLFLLRRNKREQYLA
jgi:iron complex transport system permease protein